jgi:hypothetical protein
LQPGRRAWRAAHLLAEVVDAGRGVVLLALDHRARQAALQGALGGLQVRVHVSRCAGSE